MEINPFIFLILAGIIFYFMLVFGIAKAVASNDVSGHKPFWWIFFFGIFGALIVVLLDIRDFKYKEKKKFKN